MTRKGQQQRTHCPAGHAYTKANTRLEHGRRHCRACDVEHHYRQLMRESGVYVEPYTPDPKGRAARRKARQVPTKPKWVEPVEPVAVKARKETRAQRAARLAAHPWGQYQGIPKRKK